MSFFKLIAGPIVTVGAVCATLAVTATKADAYDFCMPFMGGEICTEAGVDNDIVAADVPGLGFEVMLIECSNGVMRTTSQGQWSREMVREFANGYCDGRGWNAHN